MKKIKTYFLLVLFGFVYYGCDKPAPTQLTQDDEEQLEVEILAKDTDDEFYSSDSSGVVDDLTGYANIITVSGIKITRGFATINTAYAQAIFFDRNLPVYSPDGKLLLGFNTRLLGNVQFNSVSTRPIPFRIKYRNRNNGMHRDTLLGFRHVLNSIFQNQDFNYRYNSSVEFQLNPILGSTTSFNIPTPLEVTGNVRLEGRRTNNTLRAILEWDGKHHSKFEVILGASVRNSETVFPLFRLRIKDDGELVIPFELINRIPKRFDKFVFSFVRKIDYHYRENENDLFILSQSIHSIIIDIP